MASDFPGDYMFRSQPVYYVDRRPSAPFDDALFSPQPSGGGPSPSYSIGTGSNPTASPGATTVVANTPSQASVVSPEPVSASLAAPPLPIKKESQDASPAAQPAKRRKSGPGRPATARRIWQQPLMQRRLVRLYLYSDESTLKTKQISQLLSALARLESGNKGGDDRETESRIRSTQNELKKLLPQNYHDLRPQSREIARARVSSLRSARSRRGRKASRRARAGAGAGSELHRTDSGRPMSIISQSSLTAEGYNGAWLGTHPDIDPSRLGRSLAGQSSLTLASVATKDSKRVRLSWLRDILGASSKERPASSVLMEIRSLLSRGSIRSSIGSRKSSIFGRPSTDSRRMSMTGMSIMTTDDPAGDGIEYKDPDTKRNLATAQICCLNSQDCIHRRAVRICSDQTPGARSVVDSARFMNPEDRTAENGRDIWNETVLHLVARWGDDELTCLMLNDVLTQCHSRMVNVRNIDGDTFLHVLCRRWARWPAEYAAYIVEVASVASKQGFRFQTCNSDGLTALACLIPEYPFPGVTALDAIDTVRSLEILLDTQYGNKRTLFDSLLMVAPQDTMMFDRVIKFLEALQWAPWTSAQEAERMLVDNTLLRFQTHVVTPKLENIQGSRARGLGSQIFDTYDHQNVQNLHQHIDRLGSASGDTYGQLESVLSGGADPNEYNVRRLTCIMHVIEKMRLSTITSYVGIPMIGQLIEYGADLRLRDANGNNALHHAVRAHLPDVVQLLVRAGIDVDARNSKGETALDLAFKHYERYARMLDKSGEHYGRLQSTFVRLFDVRYGKRVRNNASNNNSSSNSKKEASSEPPKHQPLRRVVRAPDAGAYADLSTQTRGSTNIGTIDSFRKAQARVANGDRLRRL
ncbi:hypothetical protein Micbo1qcDRAFT_205923 [Microdochium bolleyi]|uniref:Uncharacterized protein n=1 Tax=Microdochium bolleyi TaxID=196109 RepID=A0A136IZV2_9PEZI|nr:hypothetical protein Micbo1qcDRAFT_205923 [Microdochium bolleyi]